MFTSECRLRVRQCLTVFLFFAMLAQVALAGTEAVDRQKSSSCHYPQQDASVDTEANLARRIKAEPSTLNPILMYTAVDAEFEYLIWDRPIVIDSRFRWKLNDSVAEAYTEAADHMSAVLTLREGLCWHDGKPFTASDVAYSWSRIVDERVVCRRARTGPDQLVSCEALDDFRVRFTFAQPLPTNRWNVNFPILPEHVYKAVADADPTLAASEISVFANRNPIGNGPYRLESWSSGQRIVLARWDDYQGPKPAFKRIVFRVVPDNNTALAAFETGQLDEMELSPQQYALETDNERFAGKGVKSRGEQWSTYYIGWNCGGASPFLVDPKVRRALCHAVDIQRIIDHVYFGVFTPSLGLFHPDSWVGKSGVDPYAYDLELADKLLDEAGWLKDERDSMRYKEVMQGTAASRVPAKFTLSLVQGSQTSPKVADLMRDSVRRLGVDMRTETLEWSVFGQRVYNHEFDAYFSAWTAGVDPDEAWNLFHSAAIQGGRNYTAYANATVDGLFERGRHCFPESQRREYYREIDRIIYRDAPYTFLVNAPALWAFSRSLRGIEYSPRGPINFYPGVLAWWKVNNP